MQRDTVHTDTDSEIEEQRLTLLFALSDPKKDLFPRPECISFNEGRLLKVCANPTNFIEYGHLISFASTHSLSLFVCRLSKVIITRAYPKANRVDSSNYNPAPFWNSRRTEGVKKEKGKEKRREEERRERVEKTDSVAVGCHCAAMNYQTAGLPMWINDGRFRINARSG